jgi:dephospho-CoA kinase/adenylate kinase family enzyme
MSPEKIILVGPSATGKDTVLDRMSILTGANIISTSDEVRKSATEAGLINPTRNDIQQFANSMRNEYGENIFAKLAAEKIKNQHNGLLIINGIRNPSEIEVFGDALIIGISASKEKRFERTLKRNKPSDPKNWNEFLICDTRENGTVDGKKGQQNYQCLAKADIIINNEGDSIENLEYMVDLLVDQLVKKIPFYHPQKILNPQPYENHEKKTIIIANGPHGAGKTLIGKNLSKKLSIDYIHEIGGQLRQEVEYNALESNINFDREVMRRELLRDHQLLRDKNSETYIIETWHTGNIAYATERSPNLTPIYLEELKKQLQKFSILHLLFTINDSTFLKRATEKVPEDQKGDLLEFYKKITNHTQTIYSRFNLDFKEVENNGEISLAEEIATRTIQSHITTV